MPQSIVILYYAQLHQGIPEHHTGRHAHIKGVLGAELRDFHGQIAQLQDCIIHPKNFVAEHQRQRPARRGPELRQGHAARSLLYGHYLVAGLLERGHGFHRFDCVFPAH